MIEVVNRDIWTFAYELGGTIVLPVNTAGVMGAGLARQAFERYPDILCVYQHDLADGSLMIGSVTYCEVLSSTNPGDWQQFILFPTKTDWRLPSELFYIGAGLYDLQNKVGFSYDTIRNLHVPALGCGLGGLNFEHVLILMYTFLNHLEIPVYVYEPQ